MRPCRFALLVLLLLPAAALGQDYASERAAMIRAIERNVRETSEYLDREDLDPRVLEAMGEVPRHELVPAARRGRAYENRPLPIGHGQTISQPYIVAIMTDFLEPEPGDKVLEVGTGSGYQAAVLSRLVDKVYTIEIIEALGERARRALTALGYDNIDVRIGDGYFGWPGQAPFDSIVVTAAASHVPPPLIEQLKPGGRMMIPVGSRFLTQQLLLVTKDEQGSVKTRQLLPVRFVPLTGDHD